METCNLKDHQACHFRLSRSVHPPRNDAPFGSLSEPTILCCSIDLGHPHLAVAGLQHPPSHPCIALEALRRLGRLGEPAQDRQQIPESHRLVSDKQ